MFRQRQDLFRKSEAAKYFPKGVPHGSSNKIELLVFEGAAYRHITVRCTLMTLLSIAYKYVGALHLC